VVEYLSPRESDDLEEARARGLDWARVVRCFLDGARLLLGWDRALSEDAIARLAGIDRAGVGAAIDEAVRWCVAHRLHLLGWQEPDDAWLYFMAVG